MKEGIKIFFEIFIAVASISILVKLCLDLFKSGRKVFAYLGSIVIIFIFSITINTILIDFIKLICSNNQHLYEMLGEIHRSANKIINAYSTIFTFLIVAYLNSKIDSLNYPNKSERAIWRLYEISINALDSLGLILEIDNNQIIKIIEKNKKKSEKEVKQLIEKRIEKRWKQVTKDETVILGNILTENQKYRREEIFCKVINELNIGTENIIITYKDFISDEIYKYLAQLSYELRRYKFSSTKKMQEYNKKIIIKYISDLIYYLNKINQKWYDYYKKEIKKYNKKNKSNDVYMLGEESLRNKRLQIGISIEELCYRIGELSGNEYKIKTEILYRLIENGKINANEKDINKILSAVGICNKKGEYFSLMSKK